MRKSSSVLALGISAALAVSPIARASGAGLGDGEPVPAKLALLVMLKVLTYDKNLSARGDGDFVVFVATEPGQDAARREVEKAASELDGAALRARPVKFTYGGLGDEDELRKQLEGKHAQAILLLPGTSAQGLATATRVARATQAYTLSLDPGLVEKTFAVGVTNDAGRPKIVLNLSAAKQMNATFEPAVLKLARIIP